jgi:phage terminase large subunit-like protein
VTRLPASQPQPPPLTRGGRVCAFIERYCIVPEGSLVGLPMRLDPFERDFILRVYDNPSVTSLAILSMAKKNGKTAIIAALVLVHMCGPEAVTNSQIVSGAMSRDQAGIVFEYAAKMIRLHPALSLRCRIVPSRKRIYGLARNVEYRALASDGKRIHGISPLIAILDEVGQVKGPRSEFVDAITTAQGAHQAPIVFVISTQAASDADMLSIWIDDAKLGTDPHTVLALYEAPKDCALDDRAAWRAANPALGTFRSLPDMEKQAQKALRIPTFAPTFRNLHLNQRVESSSPLFSMEVWKECGLLEVVPHAGTHDVFAALDLSAVSDLTSLVAVWFAGERWNAAARFWAPTVGLMDRARRDRVPYDLWAQQGWLTLTPGPTVDYDFVAADVLEMSAEWNLSALAFDRWRIDVFKAALARQEASAAFIEKLVPFGQGFQSMSPAVDAVEKELLAARLAHGNNPLLNMCASNAVARPDEAGNRKPDKSKRTGRIDGAVALIMAMGTAVRSLAEESPASFWEGNA